MSKWRDGYDELPDVDFEGEIMEKYLEEERVPEWLEKEMAMEEVDWEDDIEKIEDPEAKRREMKEVEEIKEMQKQLKERSESEDIAEKGIIHGGGGDLMRRKRAGTVRSFLESKGFSAEGYGGIFERWDDRTCPLGERNIREREVGEVIDELGPEAIEQLNDRMLREGKISKKTHSAVSEHVAKTRK